MKCGAPLAIAFAVMALALPATAGAGQQQLNAAVSKFDRAWKPVETTLSYRYAFTLANVQLCNMVLAEQDPTAKTSERNELAKLATEALFGFTALKPLINGKSKRKNLADLADDIGQSTKGFSHARRFEIARASGLLKRAVRSLGWAMDSGRQANEKMLTETLDCAGADQVAQLILDNLTDALGTKTSAFQLLNGK